MHTTINIWCDYCSWLHRIYQQNILFVPENSSHYHLSCLAFSWIFFTLVNWMMPLHGLLFGFNLKSMFGFNLKFEIHIVTSYNVDDIHPLLSCSSLKMHEDMPYFDILGHLPTKHNNSVHHVIWNSDTIILVIINCWFCQSFVLTCSINQLLEH